jgi:hypothetical protein
MVSQFVFWNSRDDFVKLFSFYSIWRYSGRCLAIGKIFDFSTRGVAVRFTSNYLRGNSGFDFRQII